MTGFPEAFEERMRGLLGPEYEAFRGSLEEERLQGLRANGLKISEEGAGEEFQKRFQEKFQGFGLSPVPWAADGFYYSSAARPGKSPFHEAGAYYIQEPSAMAVVSLLDPRPGERAGSVRRAGGKDQPRRVPHGRPRAAGEQRDPSGQSQDSLPERGANGLQERGGDLPGPRRADGVFPGIL